MYGRQKGKRQLSKLLQQRKSLVEVSQTADTTEIWQYMDNNQR